MKRYLLLLLSIVLIFSSRTANAQSGLFVGPNTSIFTSPLTGQSWLFDSTNRTLQVYNGSSWDTKNYPYSNLTATNNPTASNDNTQGYVVGSFWINQTTQTLYMATSVVTSAAVWVGMNVVTSTIPLADIQQGGATNNQSLVWNNGSGVWNPAFPPVDLDQLLQDGATNGQVATWSSGSSKWIPSNAGAGTVSTFSAGNLSPLFSTSTSNPTSTPALSFALTNAAGYGILSNTSSSSGVPAYNALSLTAGTGLSITASGQLAANPTISLSNPVAVSLGGTGNSSLTSYNVLLGAGAGAVAFAAPGTANYPLCSNNASSNPSFQQLSLSGAGVTGTLPIASGGSNATSGDGALNNFITGSASSGQVIEWNGTHWVPETVSGSGTVTSFSAGNLSPYFTTSVATSTTTPALSFSASSIAANTILSNTTGSSAVPSANSLSVTAGTGLIGGGNVTSSPTISLATPVSNSLLGNTVVTSASNLDPLFTTSISAQTLSFTPESVGAHYYFGNQSGASGVPAFQALSAGDLPSTTVNSTGNLSPIFTSSITSQALSFNLTNAAGNGILSNTSSSPSTPAYNVLSLTAGTGLTITSSGVLAQNPTVSLSVPVSSANGGTGVAVSTPTVSAGTGSGSGSASGTGDDLGGVITYTPGVGATTSSDQVDVVFGATYTPKSAVLTPANSTTALLSGATMVYMVLNSNGFSIFSGTTALTPATMYKWTYIVH